MYEITDLDVAQVSGGDRGWGDGTTVRNLTTEVNNLPGLYDAAIGAMTDMMCRFTGNCSAIRSRLARRRRRNSGAA